MKVLTNVIMRYQSITKIVADYTEAVKRIRAAYQLLGESQGLLKSLTKYPHVLPDNKTLYDNGKEVDRILQGIKADSWRGILEKTQANKFMTQSRYDKFEKSLKEPASLPEITIETVKDFVDNLVDSAPDMLLEFIKETFDWLKPSNWSMNYKTNQKSKYELDEKIIKPFMFQLSWNGEPKLSYYQEQSLRAMDSAFHLMDGRGTPKNGSSAFTAIKTAEQAEKREAETEYFHFKWFKNQNCHITFKRMDLVNKMNQIAGENILRGEL